MRILSSLALSVVLVTASLPAWAQTPGMHRGLLEQLRWVEFQVNSGRIVARSPYIDRSQTSSAGNKNRQERLSVNLTSGQPSLQYELRTPEELITITITEGDSFALRRESTSQEAGTALTFEQNPNQPLALEFSSHDANRPSRTLRGATLWHLLLADPDLCAEQLLPILQILRPDWNLAYRALRIEESLLRAAGRRSVQHRQRWQTLVDQLADEQFSKRQSAERQLRAVGPAILPFLQSLAFAELDAEQRSRVRRILSQLTFDNAEDAPAQVATWFIADVPAWFCLLNRADLETRQIAKAQLAQLLGNPLDFDPEASLEQRQRQWETLLPQFQPTPASP
jgi:hypothetical protein